MKDLIVECPTCKIRVIPKADGTCPGCRRDLSHVKAPAGPGRRKSPGAGTRKPVVRAAQNKPVPMEAEPPGSPVWSIWVQPRQTIRRIVDTDPTRSVIPLAMLSGVLLALNQAFALRLGDSWGIAIILAACILVGPLLGIISLYINAQLLQWTGDWLGGRATAKDVRAALAWSAIPSIFTLTTWIPKLLLFGEELFRTAKPRMEANLLLAGIFIFLAVIELAVALWGLVIMLQSMGEVQGFSAWRALGAYLLAAIVFGMPVGCILLSLGVVKP